MFVVGLSLYVGTEGEGVCSRLADAAPTYVYVCGIGCCVDF